MRVASRLAHNRAVSCSFEVHRSALSTSAAERQAVMCTPAVFQLVNYWRFESRGVKCPLHRLRILLVNSVSRQLRIVS